MGRYLVGEAGVYLTRVTRIKRSRGSDIAICDGGMNHHLGACGHLGSVIHRNYRIFRVGGEPGEATRPYELVGPLCTSIDTLGHGVELPELREGDLLGVRCSGAYGLTASPVHFIRHAPARELAAEGGAVREITDTRVGMS
jgi:diaminopimelate decarboxylase